MNSGFGLAGDLDLELVTKPIPRKLGFLTAIAPLSDSIGFLSNMVVVKVCIGPSMLNRPVCKTE